MLSAERPRCSILVVAAFIAVFGFGCSSTGGGAAATAASVVTTTAGNIGSSTSVETTSTLPGLAAGLNAGVGALAVPAADGSVLYDSLSDETRPVILRLRPGSATPDVFVTDAFSPVISRDGSLFAFTKIVGTLRSDGTATATALVTRHGLDGPDTTVAPGAYIFNALFWGGHALIAQRERVEGHETDTVSVDLDGQMHVIAGLPLAISPDGRTLVASTYTVDALLTLVDTSTGATSGRLSLRDYLAFLPPDQRATVATDRVPDVSQGQTLPAVWGTGIGVWIGDNLVLGGQPGPFVFTATSTALTPVAVLSTNTPPGFVDGEAGLWPLGEQSDAIALRVGRIDLSKQSASSTTLTFRCSVTALTCTQDETELPPVRRR